MKMLSVNNGTEEHYAKCIRNKRNTNWRWSAGDLCAGGGSKKGRSHY